MNQNRQVFVAYPYKLGDEYRVPFRQLEVLFDVKFVFADETITSRQILEKIRSAIDSSVFGIYDITGWNSNVTLELGVALGAGTRVYIAINPSSVPGLDAPSDLRGIDRLQYSSLGELRRQLHELLESHFPFTGRALHAPDFPWSPSGQPEATDMVHAAVFRDIHVHLVQNPAQPDLMTVDLSFRIDSRAWRSVDYDHAPWLNLDFVDPESRRLEIQGSGNWVVAEFEPNDRRHVSSRKELRSDHWDQVQAVRVSASRGYATSISWIENWSLSMVLARLKNVRNRVRRRLKRA